MPVVGFPDGSNVHFPDWFSPDALKQAAANAWSQLQAGVEHLATDPNNVPLDSYAHATERGLANIGQGVAQAVQGAGHLIAHPVDTLTNMASAAAALPSQTKAVIADPPTLADISDTAGVTAGNLVGNELIGAGTRAVLPEARVPSSTKVADVAPETAEPESTTPVAEPTKDAAVSALQNVGDQPKLVGSRATDEFRPDSDTDILSTLSSDQFNQTGIPALEKAGFKHTGTDLISPREAAEYDKPAHQGWSDVHYFEDANGSKLNVFVPDESIPAQVNGSGESSASLEAINRADSEQAQGVKRVAVDTRSGAEKPLIGTDAVDYKPQPYESVEFRGGNQDGEVIDQGAKARPYTRRNLALTNPSTLPEADVSRLTWNVNELDRLLEGDPAIKKVRDLKAQIPSMLADIRAEQRGVQRQINSLREDPNVTDDSPELKDSLDKLQALKNQRQQLASTYFKTPEKLGDVQKPYIGSLYPDPRLRTNLTEEGQASVNQKTQARIDQAHDNIQSLLRTETNPARRTMLQRQLNEDVVVKMGKGTRPDVIQNADGTFQIPTPEITLKVVRQLNRTVGDGRLIHSLQALVPDADRENVQYLKGTDPIAYRQAIQEAARNWAKGLRDTVAGQLEAAKGRVLRDTRKTQKATPAPVTGNTIDAQDNQ